MLRVKSFDLMESDKVNALLDKNIIANGASIFVSDGKIMIPYEDGLEANKDQKIIKLKEEKNNINIQIDLMIHSQDVLAIQKDGIKTQIEKLEKESITPGSKEAYDNNKGIKEEIKRLENVLTQTENQIISNQAEYTRLLTNVQVFDKRIAELEK